MQLNARSLYHVYNRGNNKKLLFYEEENYTYFLSKIRKYISPYCDILSYCLMPNHFHLLIHANEWTNVPFDAIDIENQKQKNPLVNMSCFSHGLQMLLSSYAKAINKQHKRTGSLFTQNTRARQTSSESFVHDYSLWCFIYIHNNPVASGLVATPEMWPYSSFGEYQGLVKRPLCNLELGRKLLSLDMNKLIIQNEIEVPDHIVDKLL